MQFLRISLLISFITSRSKILLLLNVISVYISFGQSQTIGMNSYYGANPNDNFTYDGTTLGNYSLGWYQTANAAEARISGYDGIKLFTYKQSRLSISKNGLVGIGIENPASFLDIKPNYNNADVLRLSHPTSPDRAGFIIGFGNDYSGSANSAVDLKVEYGDNVYKTLSVNRLNRNMYYIGDGNFGIGTSNPTTLLDIKPSTINADVLRLSHPTSPENAGFVLGFGTDNMGRNDYAVDFKVEYSDNIYKTISIDRQNRNFYYHGDGKVGIGTDNPTAKLHVNGNILASEVTVSTTANNFPDYVFQPDYDLMSLEEVEAYVKANSHLPEVPSAEKVEANGHKLAEMNLLLLKKIEELTLYTIEQEEKIQSQNQLLKTFEERLEKLENSKN